MVENGLYVISDGYFEKFKKLGCKFKDSKEENRPVFCCLRDLKHDGLYWAIPLSEITEQKIKNGTISRVKQFMDYKEGSLGWAYYHIGKTNKPAIYNISSAFPITDNYIEREWTIHEKPFIVPQTSVHKIIKTKLRRILSEEIRFPNKFEQRITAIKNILIDELKLEIKIVQKTIVVPKEEEKQIS